MFDLEQSIADWRREMLAAGIKSPVPLEELESHLREEIEQQVKSGLSEQEAFTACVQKIGPAHAVKSEFKKVEASRGVMRFMVANLGLVLILAGFFISGLLLLILAAWDEMLQQVNRRRRLSISLIWASLGVLNFVLYLLDGTMRKPFQLGVLVAIVVIWPLFIIHNFRRWRKNRSFTSPLT